MLIPIDTNKTDKLEAVWTKLISPFLEAVYQIYSVGVTGTIDQGTTSNTMQLTLDFHSEHAKNFVSPLLSEYLMYSTKPLEGIELMKVYETESTTVIKIVLVESKYELILSARNRTSPFCNVLPHGRVDSEHTTIPREGGDFPFLVVSSSTVTVKWDFKSTQTDSSGTPSVDVSLGFTATQVGLSTIVPTLDVNQAKMKTNYVIDVPENTTGSPRIIKLTVRVTGSSVSKIVEFTQL